MPLFIKCNTPKAFNRINTVCFDKEIRTRIPPKAISLLVNDLQGLIIAIITANEFLISAYCLMMLYIYTKICKKYLKGSAFNTEIYKGA